MANTTEAEHFITQQKHTSSECNTIFYDNICTLNGMVG